MEAKKRADAIAALCVLLIMSVPPQQRAAAKSFCECYQPCHDGCSHSMWICKVDYVEKCKEVGYREESLAAWYWVCSTNSAYGPSVAQTGNDAEGVADCKVECFKRWGNV